MYAAILGPVGDAVAPSPDDVVDIPGDAADTMYAFLAEEFVHARFGDDGEPSVVDDSLKGRGWRETVPVGRRLAHGRGEREALRRRAIGLGVRPDCRAITRRRFFWRDRIQSALSALGSGSIVARDPTRPFISS